MTSRPRAASRTAPPAIQISALVPQRPPGKADQRRGVETLGETQALHPGDAGRDPAGDLVVDRAQPPGQILGEDRLPALRADQHRLCAGLDVGVGTEVDGHVVHRDRADQGKAAAADEHLGVVGEATPDAVAVAERQHADAGIALGPPGLSVAGAVARFEGA